ncbi:MAG: CHRD domain-containing protein, partial [Gammaproteobacteria bacterium]
MKTFKLILPNLALLTLVGCGGGGGGGNGDAGNGGGGADTLPVVTISEIPGETTAIESSGEFAKFQVARTGDSVALSMSISISGNPDPVGGSATDADYELHYSDGGSVQGGTLSLAANQNSRVIEVRPVADALNEVPEVATFSLMGGTGYTMGGSRTAEFRIIDAANTDENRKVFLGTFLPQDGVATTASGTASFILQGDNDAGMLNYTFSGLGSVQVDQHVHLINGPILKDIEFTGPVFDFPWDLSLENGAPFNTEQDLLDALFEGRVYVNVHTADNLAGEIIAIFVYDSTVTPPPSSELTVDEVDLDIIRFLNQATFGATPEDYRV